MLVNSLDPSILISSQIQQVTVTKLHLGLFSVLVSVVHYSCTIVKKRYNLQIPQTKVIIIVLLVFVVIMFTTAYLLDQNASRLILYIILCCTFLEQKPWLKELFIHIGFCICFFEFGQFFE